MSIIFFIIEAGLSRDTNEFSADQSKISAPNVSDTLNTDQFGLSVRSLAIGDETVPGKTSEAQRGGGGVPQGTCTSESSTSPANVSDLLRSSSPEPHVEAFMQEDGKGCPVYPSSQLEIKEELGDMLEESVHIQNTPPDSVGVTKVLEVNNVNDTRTDEESVLLKGTLKNEKDTTQNYGEIEEAFVILVMKLEGYPERKLRLKSTQGVSVAMKKFAVASGLNWKELRYVPIEYAR